MLSFVAGSTESVVVTGYKGVGGSTNRTFCCWFKGSLVNNDYIFSYGTSSAYAEFGLLFFSGTLLLAISSGNRAWNVGSLTDGSWHHFAIKLDGTKTSHLTAWVDGSALTVSSTNDQTLNTNVATNDVAIANRAYAPDANLSCSMADVRFYSRALSDTELKILYESRGCDRITDGLEFRYLMDEKPSGQTATSCLDISGNSRDGTAVNTPTYGEYELKLV